MQHFMTNFINSLIYSLSFLTPITFRGYDSFNNITTFHNNSSFLKEMISFWIIVVSIILLIIFHKKQLLLEKKFIFKYDNRYHRLNKFFTLSMLCVTPNILIYSLKLSIWNNNDYLMYLLSLIILLLMFSTFIIKRKFVVNNFSIFDSIIIFLISLLFSIMGTWNFISIIAIYMYMLGYKMNRISLFVLLLTMYNSFVYLCIHIFDFQYIFFWGFIATFIAALTMFIQYLLIYKINLHARKWVSSILFIFIITTYMIYI